MKDLTQRLAELLPRWRRNEEAIIEKNGGKTKDELGRLIPQPKTPQDRIMFAAGQLALITFLEGAISVSE